MRQKRHGCYKKVAVRHETHEEASARERERHTEEKKAVAYLS